jgi:small subunit ribosomal protein S17
MPRRILEGRVLSDKQDKTVTVLVERRMMHPIYKKYLKKSSKFAAHDETNSAKEGDVIRIIECAPISKNKRFTVYTGAETTTASATT